MNDTQNPNPTLFDKLPKPLANKLDQFIELMNTLLYLNEENFEEKMTFLIDSEFYRNHEMYEMLINISLNICFFHPKKIPMITKLFTNFRKRDKSNHSAITKRIIINHIIHGYFNNPQDDVYVFQLYLLLYMIQYHDIIISDLIDVFKKCYMRKRQFVNQLCIALLYFGPELVQSDAEFSRKCKNFVIECKRKNLLNEKALKFVDSFDFYQKNRWEKLKKNRNRFDCGDPLLHSLFFDDLELFKSIIHSSESENECDISVSCSSFDSKQNNIDEEMNNEKYLREDFVYSNSFNYNKDFNEEDEMANINSTFNNPPLSLFTVFDLSISLISAAAGLKSTKIFKFLYEKGASLDKTGESGVTVVQLASIYPEDEIFNILKKENKDLKEGMASFVRCFDMDRFKYYCPFFFGRPYDELLKPSKPYNFKYVTSPTKSTVLVQSVLTTNFITFKMCLQNGLIDINEHDGFNLTPLDVSCQMGNKLMVEILVELGADLDQGNPLVNAAMCGHSEIVKYLLSLTYSASEEIRSGFESDDYLFQYSFHKCYNINVHVPEDMINKPDKNGVTPLYASIANSHYKVTRMLLMNKNTNLSATFKDGLTYINIAAAQNNVDILKLVIQYVKIPFEDHEVSPVASAVIAGMPDTLSYLLDEIKEHIDLNRMIKSAAVSALWLAVKFSQIEIVSILVEKEKCRFSAMEIDLARRNKDEEMLALIDKYMAVQVNDNDEMDNGNANSNVDDDDDDSEDDEEEAESEAMADGFKNSGKTNLF